MNEATIKISRNMQGLAAGLDADIAEIAGERVGFALVVFTEGRASYVSNCDRNQVVAELRKLLDCWEQGMPDIPAHEVQA